VLVSPDEASSSSLDERTAAAAAAADITSSIDCGNNTPTPFHCTATYRCHFLMNSGVFAPLCTDTQASRISVCGFTGLRKGDESTPPTFL